MANTTDLLSPSADRLRGKSRPIIVDADVHPTRVGGKIINSVRHGAAEVLDRKIVHAHVLRLALGSPFPTGVLEVADQFLLLRVYGETGGRLQPIPKADWIRVRFAGGGGTPSGRMPPRRLGNLDAPHRPRFVDAFEQLARIVGQWSFR